MPLFIACKLPHGLEITHNGRTIVLRGQNVGFDPDNPSPLGKMRGDANGFGITELKDPADADAFQAWCNAVTYRDGDKAKGKLPEPFAALENGSIQTFKSRNDAEAETNMLGDAVQSGFEGIDPATDKRMKADKIETADKK